MLGHSPLGQPTVYVENYAPNLLFSISRTLGRHKLGMKELPFEGIDTWSGFELSWLNEKGKPEIALAEFIFPCTSPNVIESKSFKLYLNSFNQTKFKSWEDVQRVMSADLSSGAGARVEVKLYPVSHPPKIPFNTFPGDCLDNLDVDIDCYSVNKDLLKSSEQIGEDAVYSHLLKSNCLATGQPDWGSVYIHYKGPLIDRESLLKYIISYRRHSGFAEHCVEEIYQDLMTQCRPEQLTVFARYTRRGGLDINPFRSNFEQPFKNYREPRQ